jgi:hypothetical protein
MLPGPNRSGLGLKSFIDPVSSIYIKDPYVDPEAIQRKQDKLIHSKGPFHERDFMPASAPKSQYSSPHAGPPLPINMLTKSRSPRYTPRGMNPAA